MWVWFIIQETKDEFCMKCMEYKNTDIFSYALHLIIITNPWVQIFCMWLSEVRNLQNAISSLYCSLLQLLFASGSFFCLSSLSESTPCWAGVMWPICLAAELLMWQPSKCCRTSMISLFCFLAHSRPCTGSPYGLHILCSHEKLPNGN